MTSSTIEAGKRFTDSTYASRDEVQAIYNQSDIEGIWKNILLYRSFYAVETDLRDIHSLPYSICLNRRLAADAYQLQLDLVNDILKLSSLNDDMKEEFLLEKKVESLSYTGKTFNSSATHNTLTRLARGEIENVSSDLFVLKAYQDSYEYAYQLDSITLKDIEAINLLCSGEEISSPVRYRKDEKEDILNPLSFSPVEQIPTHLNELLSFLSQDEIPLLLRALSICYVFTYLQPFEYYNEETAALLSKAFLKTHGLGSIGFALNIESICYASGKSFFDRMKLVEKSLDLTYCLDRFLAFSINDEKNIRKQIEELSIKNLTMKPTHVAEVPSTIHEGDIKVREPDKDFALPSFPLQDSAEEIEARARQLRQVYPQLKKKQAHFYAGHCTIGLHYTIDQFKAGEKTVYETARTSMEDLANRGFYKKECIGKKFVYTPIPIREDTKDKKDD